MVSVLVSVGLGSYIIWIPKAGDMERKKWIEKKSKKECFIERACSLCPNVHRVTASGEE